VLFRLLIKIPDPALLTFTPEGDFSDAITLTVTARDRCSILSTESGSISLSILGETGYSGAIAITGKFAPDKLPNKLMISKNAQKSHKEFALVTIRVSLSA
jgi:hypothetical protein